MERLNILTWFKQSYEKRFSMSADEMIERDEIDRLAKNLFNELEKNDQVRTQSGLRK